VTRDTKLAGVIHAKIIDSRKIYFSIDINQQMFTSILSPSQHTHSHNEKVDADLSVPNEFQPILEFKEC
jgi:hypothetical protein